MSLGSVKLYYESGAVVDHPLRSIAYELDEATGVALVTFSDEKTLNALTENMMAEVFCILEHAKRDPKVKALVWAGKGRAWCSGAALKGDRKIYVPKDIQKEYAKRNMMRNPRDMVLKSQTLAFWDFPKPQIAAVQGMAVGGAVNMAFANYFDLVLVSDDSKFKYPFVKLGLTPELGSSMVLPRLVGYARAKELLFLGEWFTAQDALRLGLANRVVPRGQLVEEAVKLARKMAAEPNQAALRLGKEIVNGYQRKELEQVLDAELKAIFASVRSSASAIPMMKPKAKM
eukprot:TRINITY_DN42867_c0_g1_i1.p1 TRINITY_DN42867_c0_g1~~TRINITY_DN42867_c0_g1_i1.p1  ORF type:complete len:312 (+),score=158.34 TRINITY_DN42867_c0_g1_i1:76-936(+)